MANFCTNCGAPLTGNPNFCSACGASLATTAAAAPQAPQTPPPTPPQGAPPPLPYRPQGTPPPPPVAHPMPQPVYQNAPAPNAGQPPYGQFPGYGPGTGGPYPSSGYGGAGERYVPDGNLTSMFLRYDNRLNRKRYIMRSLALFAAAFVVSMIFGFIGAMMKSSMISMLGTLVSVIFAVPSFMLMIRRLHDLDRPTWWCIGALIPFVNFALGLYLMFCKGTDGPNQYGPDPLESEYV